MLISYQHRFIFLHVAKVAGISIRNAIQPYVQEPERFKIKRPPKIVNGKSNPLYEMWESSLTHLKAREVKKELGEDEYNKYYTFAFVRNPWDWQVSMYHFLLQEKENTRYELVTSMRGFDEYLEWVVVTDNPYPKGACKFQIDMINDEQGNRIVHDVGRFESLAQDFNRICQTIGIDARLPYLNHSKHNDYRKYYTPALVDLVAEHFKRDIEPFEYTFEK